MPFSIASKKQIIALSLLLLNLVASLPALAVENSEQTVKSETIKAKASVWRESSDSVDNPSSLVVQTGFPDRHWWEHFNDPYLSQCIQQAINANLMLASAQQRVLEARALARQSLGREFPQITLDPAFRRSRNSATIIPSFSGSGGSRSGGFALGQYLHNYTIPLTVNYEADLWQKNRDATRALNRQADAVERDFQTTHVLVVTDVANAYFNLLAADELIALQKEVVAIAEADLGHAQNRFEAGLVDQEDVVLREGRLTSFKAQLQNFYQSQSLALNQLAVLMGKTPSQVTEFPRADWRDYTVPTEITAGLPSELLTRRPDIISAENRLEAAGFQVRVARKQMLPSINLNGQFGYSTATRENLFKWDSYIASAAASLVQPLFTGGQNRANLRVHKARYEQQLLAYRDAILQSFREVDDALASLKAHRNAYQAYEESLVSLRQRQQIQQNRLEAGVISAADVNPVLLEVVQAQEGLTQAKLLALSDTLSLYKALGGGY